MVTPSPSSLPVALPVRPPTKPSHPLHVFAARTFVPRAIACTPLSRSRTVSTPIRASFARCQHADPHVVRALSPLCFLRRLHASLNRFGGWRHHSAWPAQALLPHHNHRVANCGNFTCLPARRRDIERM
jgi:hypothetical protein